MDSSQALSRRAAQRHATAVDTAIAAAAAGRPCAARWHVPAAVVCALGAAVLAPLLLAAAIVLAGAAVLLLALHREDRRNAWRSVPEAAAPARSLPPLRPAGVLPAPDAAAPPARSSAPVPVPQPSSVHVPTQPVTTARVPWSRAPVGRPRGGVLRSARQAMHPARAAGARRR